MKNLEQKKVTETPAIVNASESHMALVFVLDTSGSMSATSAGSSPIEELNAGLNRFKQEVCLNSQTRDILDVAIIEFNDSHSIVQEYVPIEFMQHVNLQAGGLTTMSPALREALKMVDERSRFYRRSGAEPYKPWIILVSDGAPSDDIQEVANEIKALQEAGKIRLIALGVEGYDSKTLHTLTDVVFRLEGKDFKNFFDWVNKSMRAVSLSSPGEKPQLAPLDGNVYRDTSDI